MGDVDFSLVSDYVTHPVGCQCYGCAPDLYVKPTPPVVRETQQLDYVVDDLTADLPF